jgi:hypothetical protein
MFDQFARSVQPVEMGNGVESSHIRRRGQNMLLMEACEAKSTSIVLNESDAIDEDRCKCPRPLGVAHLASVDVCVDRCKLAQWPIVVLSRLGPAGC